MVRHERAEPAVRPHHLGVGQEREEQQRLGGQRGEDPRLDPVVETAAFPGRADQDRTGRGGLDDAGDLEVGRAGADRAHIVGVVHLAVDPVRHPRRDQHGPPAGPDRQADPDPLGDRPRPGSGRDDHQVGVDRAGGGPDTGEPALRDDAAGDLDPLANTRAVVAGGREQGLGGDHRLDLGVLRVEDGRGEVPGQVRLQLVGPGVVDDLGDHSGAALGLGELQQSLRAGVGGGHHQATLVVQLQIGEAVGKLVVQLRADPVPRAQGTLGEPQLGAGTLVGDQDVALTARRGAARGGAAVDHDDVAAGTGHHPGDRGTDDAGPDDENLRRGGHRCTMSHALSGGE